MIAIVENIRVALTSLLSNKLRAALTMLGISIGVAAVIVLVSLGQAVQEYIAQQFLGIGANLAFVFASTVAPTNSGGSGPPAANRTSVNFSTITERDALALQDPFNVPDAKAVVPQLTLRRNTIYQGTQTRARIIASVSQYFSVRNRSLAVGRLFDDKDAETQARVAVIGQTTLNNLFPQGVVPIGETIRVDGVPFSVIGILAKYGGTSFGDEDDIVAIPLSTAQARLQNIRNIYGNHPISVITLQATSDKSMDALVQEVKETLRRTHNIDYRNDEDFQIITQKDVIKSFGQVTDLLTIFLAIIAGISLVVGGIGIMNIMMVTVTERTREIGLRKAVGARASDVLLQFLTEATVLAVIGGLIGLLIALLSTVALHLALPSLNATVRFENVLLATTISATIGIFFGLYPANRAARLNPIDALRFE